MILHCFGYWKRLFMNKKSVKIGSHAGFESVCGSRGVFVRESGSDPLQAGCAGASSRPRIPNNVAAFVGP